MMADGTSMSSRLSILWCTITKTQLSSLYKALDMQMIKAIHPCYEYSYWWSPPSLLMRHDLLLSFPLKHREGTFRDGVDANIEAGLDREALYEFITDRLTHKVQMKLAHFYPQDFKVYYN